MIGYPTRDRRAERREATRAEILEAAWELARRDGLAGLSLRDLAHTVGMKSPSLYSYFASKNAIYDAMYAQGSREFAQGQAQLVYTGDPLMDLTTLLRYWCTFCTEDPVRYQLLIQRTIPGFEPSADSFAISERSLAAVREVLAGLGFTDPADLDLFTAIGTGLTSQQIANDPGGDRWLRLIDEAVEMFVTHVSRRQTTERRELASPDVSPRLSR